jgi:hypothetical protein
MYHVIFIALIATISLAVWNLIHSSPRSLAMFLPPRVTFIAGAFFLVFGIFFAFVSAYALQNGVAMISFLIKAHLGLWLLLAHIRGDAEIVRKGFLMLWTLIVILVGVYYVQDPRAIAFLTLFGLAAGYWVTMSHTRFLDRGR